MTRIIPDRQTRGARGAPAAVVSAPFQAAVLVTGGAGLLGSTLLRTAPPGVELHATERTTPVRGARAHKVDLAAADAVRDLWRAVRPALVIHTAYSQTAPERDIEAATRNVVDACRAQGAGLLYMSTDALLDGESAPYAEDARPAPVHEYGRWKAGAEEYVRSLLPEAAVIRTSLILSLDPLDRASARIASALRANEPITLFVDELRCATAAEDLARQIWEIAALPAEQRSGVWHLAGPEALSRYAIGVLIAARMGLDPAGITAGLSAAASQRRPRDLRLLTTRADRVLRTRPRGASNFIAG